MHAETVLLVDHGEPEIAKADAFLEQRMGPDRDVDRAGGEPIEDSAAFRALVAAGEEREPQPGGAGEGAERLIMLAGEDLGRRHKRGLAPGFDAGRHREKRDQRLARSDIALQ